MTTATSMETANYRYHRRMAWQVLRSRYAAEVADGLDAGASEVDARRAAARPLRGETRALMSELLTHAPVSAVLVFLKAAQEWGDSGELLLEQGDVVLAIVDTVEPRPPWRGPDALGRDAAEDDARWTAWVQTWLVMFRATGPEAAAAVSAPATPTPPPKPPASGGTSAGRRNWAPLFYSAAAVVGTTAVVALLTRK
jgi:hypothetical protein